MKQHIPLLTRMHRQGCTVTEMFDEIAKVDKTVNYTKVRRFLKKMLQGNFKEEREYAAKGLRGNIDAIEQEISVNLTRDSSVSAPTIAKQLQKNGISVSVSSIKNIRQRMGYKRTTTKYVHMIRDVNKEKRVEFCKMMLDRRECFFDVVFTDECTVQLDASTKTCFVLPGQYYNRMKSRCKHPAKVHIWAGISRRGPTALCMFDGRVRMDSAAYCEILADVLLPFRDGVCGGHLRLAQDNAPSHKSRYTTAKLQEWNLEVLDWPAESPDLNPIELVWGIMKNYLRTKSMKTVAELKDQIEVFWQTLTPEVCGRYIDGIPSKMERVLAQDGANINEC